MPETAPAFRRQPPDMRRAQVVQAFVDLFPAARYLEIGVFQGQTFHEVVAPVKVAVDPNFQFDLAGAAEKNPNDRYHQVESDQYFSSICQGDDKFEVIFIDGMHTYEQVLKDLLSSMDHLADGGCIIIDDVKPINYASSLPDQSAAQAFRAAFDDADGRWMGDVYKIVFFISSYLTGFSFATVSETYGQLVLWRERRRAPVGRTMGDIARMEFCDVVRQVDAYRLAHLHDIVEQFKAKNSDD